MRQLAPLLILFVSTTSFAEWETRASFRWTGSNPQQIASVLAGIGLNNEVCYSLSRMLSENIARLSTGLSIDRVVSLSIDSSEHFWVGSTSCAPNDPRLYALTCTGSVSRETESFSFEESLPPGDPCANAKKPAPNVYRSKKINSNFNSTR